MGPFRHRLYAPAWVLLALAASLELGAGCQGGAPSETTASAVRGSPEVAARSTAVESAGGSSHASIKPRATTATTPDYSTWTTRQLDTELRRLKKLAPSYYNLTPDQRAEVDAVLRARSIRRSHPVVEDRPARGSDPRQYPGDSVKTVGGAR